MGLYIPDVNLVKPLTQMLGDEDDFFCFQQMPPESINPMVPGWETIGQIQRLETGSLTSLVKR